MCGQTDRLISYSKTPRIRARVGVRRDFQAEGDWRISSATARLRYSLMAATTILWYSVGSIGPAIWSNSTANSDTLLADSGRRALQFRSAPKRKADLLTLPKTHKPGYGQYNTTS